MCAQEIVAELLRSRTITVNEAARLIAKDFPSSPEKRELVARFERAIIDAIEAGELPYSIGKQSALDEYVFASPELLVSPEYIDMWVCQSGRPRGHFDSMTDAATTKETTEKLAPTESAGLKLGTDSDATDSGTELAEKTRKSYLKLIGLLSEMNGLGGEYKAADAIILLAQTKGIRFPTRNTIAKYIVEGRALIKPGTDS
ncbi:MAG: hypothetical protein U1F26_17870 [Lysobacterales bacterium]